MGERVAVIGGGMAGLTAAWLCRRAGHEVSLFEAQAQRGMDAHTLNLDGGGVVDVPLRVMSPHAWKSVFALCEAVGAPTFEVDTCAAFSWQGGATWLRNGRLRWGAWAVPTLPSPRFVNRHSAAVGLGLARLALATRRGLPGAPLGAFLADEDLPPVFVRAFLLPLLTTICTCDEPALMAWPTRDLLALFQVILHGKSLHRLQNNTPALVDRLVGGLDIRAPERVTALTDEGGKVRLCTASGFSGEFDRAFVATQANQTAFLDPARFARERALLARFPYDSGALVVHSDPRFLPRRRQDWSALNYAISPDLARQMFTVWVNPIEPSIASEDPIFQTWNPLFEPAEGTILRRVAMQRAVVNADSAAAQSELDALHADPDRRVFICGSYAARGVPLLESAVRSAVAVAARIGAGAPWAAA